MATSVASATGAPGGAKPPTKQEHDQGGGAVLVIVGLAAVGGAGYLWWRHSHPATTTTPPASPPPSPAQYSAGSLSWPASSGPIPIYPADVGAAVGLIGQIAIGWIPWGFRPLIQAGPPFTAPAPWDKLSTLTIIPVHYGGDIVRLSAGDITLVS